MVRPLKLNDGWPSLFALRYPEKRIGMEVLIRKIEFKLGECNP